MIKAIISAVGRRFIRKVCLREFQRQQYAPNERPVEYRFLFEQLAELAPPTVLDVGTGTTAVPSLIANCGIPVTAIDNVRDFWPRGMFNRHFHVLDQDITAPTLGQRFDLISCLSVLEHIRDQGRAVDAMFRLLRPGGHLVLTGPFTAHRYCENVYVLPGSDAFGKTIPFICQSYSQVELEKWLARNHGSIVKQEFWQYYQGEFWSCGERVSPPRRVGADARHQITCLLLRKAG